jgi:hypothetical protein
MEQLDGRRVWSSCESEAVSGVEQLEARDVVYES